MGWQLRNPGGRSNSSTGISSPTALFGQGGSREPKSNLSVLYSTVQAVVALRALGERPRIDPFKVIDRFFVEQGVSEAAVVRHEFFPLLRNLGKPSLNNTIGPCATCRSDQKDDGYLGDHVADLPDGPLLPPRWPAHAQGRQWSIAFFATRGRTGAGHQGARLGRTRLFRRSLHPAAIRREVGSGAARSGSADWALGCRNAEAASAIIVGGTPTWTPSTSSSVR